MVGSGADAASARRGNESTSAAGRSGKNGPAGTSTPVYRRHEADKTVHDTRADRFEHRGPKALVGESFGYNLFVGHAISAASRDARERLLRYCLRPQLSLERLSVARDGKIVCQVKATRHGKATQRIMAPGLLRGDANLAEFRSDSGHRP
jgi:hypothetical protein